MMKVIKINCSKDVSFGKSGNCIAGKSYLSRFSDKMRFLILTEENKWADATNPHYIQGVNGKCDAIRFLEYPEYFQTGEPFYIKKRNLKYLNNDVSLKPVN